MRYELNTWRNGTSQTGLSVPVAAGLLADWETITVGVLAGEDGPGVSKGEPVPGLSMTLWPNPLSGDDGEPAFLMRWTAGTAVAPGTAEAEVMHRVITRAARIARRAEALLDETPWPEEDAEFDLVHALTVLAVAALRSPEGTSPAGATALAGLRRDLGVDGRMPVDDAIATIRTALEAQHADR